MEVETIKRQTRAAYGWLVVGQSVGAGLAYTAYKLYKCKKKLNSLKQCLMVTRPTSHNQNSKNQKGAITLAARRHNVNVLLRNSIFTCCFSCVMQAVSPLNTVLNC